MPRPIFLPYLKKEYVTSAEATAGLKEVKIPVPTGRNIRIVYVHGHCTNPWRIMGVRAYHKPTDYLSLGAEVTTDQYSMEMFPNIVGRFYQISVIALRPEAAERISAGLIVEVLE